MNEGKAREEAMVDAEVDAVLRASWEAEEGFPQRIFLADAAEVVQNQRADLDRLAHGLAYSFACLVIESECIKVDGFGGVGPHFDLREEGVFPGSLDDFRDCARYLEARGLLERDPDFPHLVQVRDESEAAVPA